MNAHQPEKLTCADYELAIDEMLAFSNKVRRYAHGDSAFYWAAASATLQELQDRLTTRAKERMSGEVCND